MSRRPAFLFCLALVWAATAPAADLRHTVAVGESLSAIAKRYYGDFAHTELLQRYNDRGDAGIRPGETLHIPSSPVHRVRPGDTGSALATRYLGQASAWPTIAALNGAVPEAPLRVGTELTIPVVLRHALARGESLAALAARYYGDPARARVLQSFNRIDDPRELSVGQVVGVPLLAPRLVARTAAPTATPPQPAPAPAGPPAWFETGLAGATAAYRAGDFDTARERLDALAGRLDDVPAAADRGRLWRLATFVHVAFDRDEAACAAFEALEREQPDVTLDPDLVSPKIRESLRACADVER